MYTLECKGGRARFGSFVPTCSYHGVLTVPQSVPNAAKEERAIKGQAEGWGKKTGT